MFRNPFGEFNLSSGRGSRRSFRPECEALEQRIVPDATVSDAPDTLAPSSHAQQTDSATFQKIVNAIQLVQAFDSALTDRVRAQLSHADPQGLKQLGNLARNFGKQLRIIQKLETQIFASRMFPNDPPVQLADALFHAAVADFQGTLNNARRLGQQGDVFSFLDKVQTGRKLLGVANQAQQGLDAIRSFGRQLLNGGNSGSP